MRIGSLQLRSNLLLAPLARYTDLPFRLMVRQLSAADGPWGTPYGGVGLAFTELLCDRAILKETDKTLWLAATNDQDRPLGMQLYGRIPDKMAAAAQWAQARGATLIDINMGCPVDKVTKTNGGSKLLCEPDLAVTIAQAVVRAVTVPVTCKIRLGWDDTCLVGPELAVRLADAGVAAITVHGRTTAQLFRGSVRLAGIAEVVAAVKKQFPVVPVIGNGDVKTPQDAKRMLEVTGCDGVMIGRGALGQPWIFRDTAHYLATGRLPASIPQAQRARIVLGHFDSLTSFRGEQAALNMIRQRISWYSPHLQPWPHLRQRVHEVKSAAEFRVYMLQHIDELQAAGDPRRVAGVR